MIGKQIQLLADRLRATRWFWIYYGLVQALWFSWHPVRQMVREGLRRAGLMRQPSWTSTTTEVPFEDLPDYIKEKVADI